jgi:GT2 family glycosyltransferase
VTTFAIVTVNYGSSRLISENFSSLRLPPGGRLIIVDSFSSVAEQEAVRAVSTELDAECILLPDNRGYGGGTNAGATRAIELGIDVIVPLNPDASIDEASLRTIVDAAHGTRDIVSPRIITGGGRNWFTGADLYLDDGTTAGWAHRDSHAGRPRREWATGACFALSSDVWAELGGFDEDYFLYWEDIDLSHRVLDAGGALVLTDAVVVHDEGGTHSGRGTDRTKSPTYYYYNIRNRMMYAAKHLDAASVRRWGRSAPRVAYAVLLQGGRRQLLSMTPWRAFFRGLRDGRGVVRNGSMVRDGRDSE